MLRALACFDIIILTHGYLSPGCGLEPQAFNLLNWFHTTDQFEPENGFDEILVSSLLMCPNSKCLFVRDEHIYEIKVDCVWWQTMAVVTPGELIFIAVGYLCSAETQKSAENQKTSVTIATGIKTDSSDKVLSLFMSNLLDARGVAVWGKGRHETVMLPSDSFCSTGTSCCVVEVHFKLGGKKGCLVQIHNRKFCFIMFFSYLPPPRG